LSTAENAVQNTILRYLKLKGYYVWRQNQGGVPTGRGGFRAFNGLKGLPDIMGFMPKGKLTGAQMLFIECKRPKSPGKPEGKPSPEQLAFLQAATWPSWPAASRT
jgi:hypothetical protein